MIFAGRDGSKFPEATNPRQKDYGYFAVQQEVAEGRIVWFFSCGADVVCPAVDWIYVRRRRWRMLGRKQRIRYSFSRGT